MAGVLRRLESDPPTAEEVAAITTIPESITPAAFLFRSAVASLVIIGSLFYGARRIIKAM